MLRLNFGSFVFLRIALCDVLLSGRAVSKPYRTAVCLHGKIRKATVVLGNIAERLLLPLAADTFVYTPMVEAGMIRSPSAVDLQLLYSLPGLRALRIETEDANSILEGLAKKYHDSNDKVSTLMEYTLKFAGNWLGGVLEAAPKSLGGESVWRRPGSGLFQMISQHRCYEMVTQAESANGEPYDWVVSARMDMYWEHPHLPLQLLSEDAIWIPAGMDFGGVNDRYAAIPRKSMPKLLDAYWGALDLVARGVAAEGLNEALPKQGPLDTTGCDEKLDGPVQQPCANPELWLSIRFIAFNVTVKRMPLLQWTLCGGHPKSDCEKVRSNFKLGEEHTLATSIATCLQKKGVGRYGWVDAAAFDGSISDVRSSLFACWCREHDIERLCHTDGCSLSLLWFCTNLGEHL